MVIPPALSFSGRHQKKFRVREADDIANLTFISGKTNRKITGTEPFEYMPKLLEKLGKEIFNAQCVPNNTDLLKKEKYKDFLRERRKSISEMINAFLGRDE